jgi:hypothetical protein
VKSPNLTSRYSLAVWRVYVSRGIPMLPLAVLRLSLLNAESRCRDDVT